MYIEENVDYINRQLAEVKGKKTVLWGASEYTVRLFQYSNIVHYNIQDIVDNCKAGQTLFGRIVLNPDAIRWDTIDAVVLASFYRKNEIVNELIEKYKYNGKIVILDFEGANKPFYEHLSKYDMFPKQDNIMTLNRNVVFKDKHKGERVFILACGPSIGLMDLSDLENENTIAMNNFYLHQNIAHIRPKYYVTAAFEDDYTNNVIKEWIIQVYKSVPQTTMFFNIKHKGVPEQIPGLDEKKLFYYNDIGIDDFHNLYEDVDLTKKIMVPHSTPILCIQIALYMGFKEIYLIGAEHDSVMTGQYKHFYKYGENVDKRECEHEDGILDYPIELGIRGMAGLWEQYKVLRSISEKKDIKIYNATIGGALDLFSRVDYKNLLKK